MKLTPRHRRLISDYYRITSEFSDHKYINLILERIIDFPPEKYTICYKGVKGIKLSEHQPMKGKKVEVINDHIVEVYLHSDYPRIKPQCYCITNIFHPNFRNSFPHEICIGDYWASGESLSDIIYLIGDMIQYLNFSVKYPLNGVAAKWVKENMELLPIGKINLRNEDYKQFVKT